MVANDNILNNNYDNDSNIITIKGAGSNASWFL